MLLTMKTRTCPPNVNIRGLEADKTVWLVRSLAAKLIKITRSP